jgi:hypothetical protein
MMEPLFLCSRELVKEQGRGYKFTIPENESTILLFWQNESTILLFWQNEKTILLFGVGRGYEFTDEEKESGGARM